MKENEFKENFKRAKNLNNALKKDDESVLFASEKINKQFIKKIKRFNYYMLIFPIYGFFQNQQPTLIIVFYLLICLLTKFTRFP